MRAHGFYCSRLEGDRKTFVVKFGDVSHVDPPRRFDPPTPAEKARRVDELRVALDGSAREFQARLRPGGEGQR